MAQRRGGCTEPAEAACQYLATFKTSKLTGQPPDALQEGGEAGEAGKGGEGACRRMEGEALESMIADVDARKKLAASQGVCVCVFLCVCVV